MSDEVNGTPSAQPQPSIPADLVSKLASAEAMKSENAKLSAEREALLKAHDELKASVQSFQEKFGTMEAESKKLAEANRRMRIEGAVRDAARDHGALDPDDLTELLSKKFTLDENNAVIVSDDTKAKASDYVKSFLEKKPHYAGRKIASGSGASPFPAQSAPVSQQFDMNTDVGLTNYVRSLTHQKAPQK